MIGKVEKLELGEKYEYADKRYEPAVVTIDGNDYAYNRWEKMEPLEEGCSISYELGDRTKQGLIKLMKVKRVDANTQEPSQKAKGGSAANYWNSDEKIKIDIARLKWEMWEKQWGISRSVGLEKAMHYYELHKTLKPTEDDVERVAERWARFIMKESIAKHSNLPIPPKQEQKVEIPLPPQKGDPNLAAEHFEYDRERGADAGHDDDLPF